MYCVLVVCCLVLRGCSAVKNVNVVRSVDVQSHVIRVEHDITVDEATDAYHFSVHPSEVAHVSYITASSASGKTHLGISEMKNNPGVYSVNVKKLVQPIRFTVTTVMTNKLEAKPAEILQSEKQFLKYTGSVMFYSPYLTEEQVTHIILPNGELLRYTNTPEPISKQGKKLVYGPYRDIKANSYLPLHVHFENDIPFLTVTSMSRHIEISHWGNVAVEENLEIRNAGAKLRGPFSRLDFDMGHGQQNAVVSFKTALPAAAKDIYYRDEIGNISTSSVVELLDAVEVKLSPRFPLMGGWKTQYTLGYNVPAHEFLHRHGSQFSLRMRFMDHIYDDQIVEDLTVKIVLPEMATDIEFIPPYPVKEKPRETLKTYLDTVGRTVLVYQAKNLVTEHILDFTLNYRFNMLYMLREPLMMITAFCVIFVFILIYVRLDFSIFRDEKAELRLRAQAIVDEAQDVYKQRAAVYQSYEDAVSSYKSGKDAAKLISERRRLEGEHKKLNQLLTHIQGKLAELCTEGVEKLREVMTIDSSYRDLIQESVQLAERLINGKINKAQYQASDSDLSAKKADLIGRADAIMENL
ncbi:Dolichyl-diphosphooligosaccharide--protein glycosyltransferase subunit 1 [Paragonimus heterotremus]|uniref:Dolichyl-diphosphooligosaccharide--protein glycosyltransferase subunit 1 n=1 Tax=Paragonimus heterotremus TaxID=100268 RepID=A0A8J4T5V5_9TREM|nr:Dolichyl-diphosphooligosaccharide--protein glycosyltransferase subunit 1 [Paragonimus heterotremus]